MNIPRVELEIKEDDQGVFAVSLVDRPAIQSDFVKLSEDDDRTLNFKTHSKLEEGYVVGFALIPDIDIYRKIKGKEFNVYMSRETVNKSAEMFMKNQNLSEVTEQHNTKVKGCYVTESWIVEDAKNDKANIYDLNPKGGEWVIKMKIDNPEMKREIESGRMNGFSIEGIYSGMDSMFSNELSVSDMLNDCIEKLNKIK